MISRGTEIAYHAKTQHVLHPRGIQLNFRILIVYMVLHFIKLVQGSFIKFCMK